MLQHLQKRLYFLIPAAVVVLLHNLIHESVHYVAARLCSEAVLEFRFLTNGWGTSQVVYATPVAAREGPHWLIIAWSPAVVTVLIGYIVYWNRRRWWTSKRWINGILWYAGLFFLCLDPFYFAVLSLMAGGSDIDAAQAMGWSPWPVRAVAAAVLILNGWLMVRWWRDVRAHPDQ